MFIDRKEFMEELNEEIKLRQYVRKAIKIIRERKTKEQYLQEQN